MPTLNSILTECATSLLATEDEVDVDTIVACAYGQYGEVFAEERERLVWDAARRIAKNVMRSLSDDDESGQQRLPGLHLPSAIAVPKPDGSYIYVQTEKATWSVLRLGRLTRATNVDHAKTKLDQYDESLDRLRPFMETDALCTVTEALRREAALRAERASA